MAKLNISGWQTIKGALGCVPVLPICLPEMAYADPVVLVANDFSARIYGNLVDYEKGLFLIATELGEIWISSEAFCCRGEGCPTATEMMVDRMKEDMWTSSREAEVAYQ